MDQLLTHLPTEPAPIFKRVVIVESRVDACPEHLFEQVVRVLECVGVNAVGESEAVDHDAYARRSKVVFDQIGHRSRDARVGIPN